MLPQVARTYPVGPSLHAAHIEGLSIDARTDFEVRWAHHHHDREHAASVGSPMTAVSDPLGVHLTKCVCACVRSSFHARFLFYANVQAPLS